MRKSCVYILFISWCILFFTGCDDNNRNYESRSLLDRASRAKSLSNLKQIGMAALMYGDAYDGYYPDSLKATSFFLGGEVPKFFIAPFDQQSQPAKDITVFTEKNTSYAWLLPLVKLNKIRYPANTPAAFEKPWIFPEKTDKIAILYADGHIDTKKISGVSQMTCRQVAEILIHDLEDENLCAVILAQAEKIDLDHFGYRTVPAPPEKVIVTLTKNGTIRLNKEVVSKEELQVKLRELAANAPKPQLLVRGDGENSYAKVIELLALVRQCGFKDAILVTQPESDLE